MLNTLLYKVGILAVEATSDAEDVKEHYVKCYNLKILG